MLSQRQQDTFRDRIFTLSLIHTSMIFRFPEFAELAKQECIPVGYVPTAAVAIPGRGVSLPEVGCLPRGWGCLPRGRGDPPRGGGVCLPRGGGCLPRGHTHTSHLDRMTGTCKNITLPQLHCRR